MKRFLLFLSFLGIFSCQTYAQALKNISIEAKSNIGFLLAQRVNLQGYALAHFAVTEINIAKKTNGSKSWHHLYHYPEYGITLLYTDIGKNKYTGFSTAAAPFIQFAYLRTKHADLNFKLAIGLGYTQKIFNRTTNYKDIVIGSHINSAIQFQQNLYFHLNANHSVGIGFGITHFSNGSFKVPNLGINIVSGGLSYKYNFKRETQPVSDSSKLSTYKMNAIVSTGIKQVYPVGGNYYGVQTFTLQGLRKISQKTYLGISADLFNDISIRQKLNEDSIIANNNLAIFQAGLAINYHVVVGKFSFPLQVGTYLFTNYKANGAVYCRLGVQYQLKKHLLACINLKTHYAKADFFEYGIGYTF